MNLLQVEKLNIDLKSGHKTLSMVRDASFHVQPGEILALVGESGCGKSISCLALTGLLPSPPLTVSARSISFDGQELAELSGKKMRKIRGGGIAYIFQEPSASLNPVMRTGEQIAETIRLHRPEIKNIRQEVIRCLGMVGIPAPESRIDSFPHELSGGMQQRVMIAMALAGKPRLLIADEPTTALDVTIQAQILDLIDRMRRETGMGVILVTHNLGIVAETADRVAVMYAGSIVESGTVREILEHPLHPYTRALLEAVPRQGEQARKLKTIAGNVPAPDNFPAGCRFYGRCGLCAALPEELQKKCADVPPDESVTDSGRRWRCHAAAKETAENIIP